MRSVPSLTVVALAIAFAGPTVAEPSVVAKDRVSAKLHRDLSKAVVCLSARDPVHLSGEYGIHVSWTPKARAAKDIELYSKSDYFAVPVRVEVPLPRDARTVKVEVGACVEGDYCDSVEMNLELRKAAVESTVDTIDCKP
jgi:hypothetical protein